MTGITSLTGSSAVSSDFSCLSGLTSPAAAKLICCTSFLRSSSAVKISTLTLGIIPLADVVASTELTKDFGPNEMSPETPSLSLEPCTASVGCVFTSISLGSVSRGFSTGFSATWVSIPVVGFVLVSFTTSFFWVTVVSFN